MLLESTLLTALLSSGPVPVAAEKLKATVPDQPVEVSVDITGFKREEGMEHPGRTLLAGEMKNDAVISVLWEENYPYVAASECGKTYSKEKGFKTFTVDGKVCVQFRSELRGMVCQSQFYAYLVTPDYLYTIHVSRTYPMKDAGSAKELRRNEVESIVKSLEVSGTADRSAFVYPAAVYDFRDEAAKSGSGQLEWVTKQCAARPEEWVPKFYLAELARNSGEEGPELRGYARAGDLLAKREDRSPKETRVLLVCLDSQALHFARKQKFDQARPFCESIVATVKADDPEEIRSFRHEALFNLACIHAMASQPDEAMECLRQAIEAKPEFKKRASEETMLASLRTKPEFKKLVGK